MAKQTAEQARTVAAHRWMSDRLALLGRPAAGAIETVKDRPWSLVLRVRTEGGAVYCKANAPGGRHEPALLAALARRWPDRVPAPLDLDLERGWLLLEDYGTRLDAEVTSAAVVDIWQRLLPRYAEIQLDSSRDPGSWIALGVPDRRLERLSGQLESLLGEPELALSHAERSALRALAPDLEACARELAQAPFAAALAHCDLHHGNVLGSCATPTSSPSPPGQAPQSYARSSPSPSGSPTSAAHSTGTTC